MEQYEIFWLIAAVVLFVIEALTVNLVTLWFAFGAVAAFVAALFDISFPLQLVIYFAVTILTLIITRPIVKKKFLSKERERTNADMVIGKLCTVTEDIDNLTSTGRVEVMGKSWSARSASGDVIEKGEKAKVIAIEGVKLIVERS